jgi:hypothetical protein
LKFTTKQLREIFLANEQAGPRGAYEFFYGQKPASTNEGTTAVEDFIIAFYTQYNAYAGYSVF